MNPAAWLDDLGKPAWIAAMILGFIFFWPAGLVILGYLIGSGRMGCWTAHRGGRWQAHMDRWQQRMKERAAQWSEPRAAGPSSGNRAFDEYREDTLRRYRSGPDTCGNPNVAVGVVWPGRGMWASYL